MERIVAMPKLGMTMTEGVLLRWYVSEGSIVAKDDVLAEVETDKVELEVESPVAGRVTRLYGEVGASVPVGEPLALIETNVAAPVAQPTSATVPSAAPTPAPLPGAAPAVAAGPATLLPSISAAPVGQVLSRGRVPSTPAARRLAQERGFDLARIAAGAQAGGSAAVVTPVRAADVLAFAAVAEPQPATAAGRGPTLTPLARKLAEAHALAPSDLAALAVPGDARRLPRQVVADAVAARAGSDNSGNGHLSAPAADTVREPAAAPVVSAPLEPAQAEADEQVSALSSMRRAIAERTTHSFTTTPHIYLDTEVDMTEIEAMRALYAGRPGAAAPSVTALLVRVAAVALRRHPEVNAGFVAAGAGQPMALRRWQRVHVGVAVALPDGLLVPVVRDADQKPLAQIAAELADLTQRARERRLLPDDLTGATFSISNLGMYGLDTFHAIINEPQAAILAVGRSTRRPVVVSDATGAETIAIRSLMKLSLSADHRVLDGASGARFVATLRELLEEPRLLI